MLFIEDDKIYITRADDAVIKVDIVKKDGTPYTMQTGDFLTITVRNVPDPSVPALLRMSSTNNSILIPSDATMYLTPGEYSADVQLKNAVGRRYTLYPTVKQSDIDNWKNFVVLPEVTDV